MNANEVQFVEDHREADELVVEKRTGRVVGAVYRTNYGRQLGDLRAFLYAAGAVSEDDEALASLLEEDG